MVQEQQKELVKKEVPFELGLEREDLYNQRTGQKAISY